MKTRFIFIVFAVSFMATVITLPQLGVEGVTSLIIFAATCLYMGRNKKRIEADIDELFGRDHELR